MPPRLVALPSKTKSEKGRNPPIDSHPRQLHGAAVLLFFACALALDLTVGDAHSLVELSGPSYSHPRIKILGDLDADGYPEISAHTHGQLTLFSAVPGGVVEWLTLNAWSGHTGYQPTQVTSGDVNGDGMADLIVSAPETEPLGVRGAGAVHVFYGPLSAPLHMADADVILSGGPISHAGVGVVVLPDSDGDGDDELVVGGDGWGGTDSAVWVVPGGFGTGVIELDLFGRMTTWETDFGAILLPVADLDGDGGAELAILTSGSSTTARLHVVMNPLENVPPGVATDLLTVSRRLYRGTPNQTTYRGNLVNGQFDGTGPSDLIWGYSTPNRSGGMLISGDVITNLPQGSTTRIESRAVDLRFNQDQGVTGTALGDRDGDGIDELLVANLTVGSASTNVVSGRFLARQTPGTVVGSIPWVARIVGRGAVDLYGGNMAVGGDVNLDGLPDVWHGVSVHPRIGMAAW